MIKIQIKYKETELKHIIEQINVIDTDSLLFLNSIQKICIVVDEEVKEYVKNAEKSDKVADFGERWFPKNGPTIYYESKYGVLYKMKGYLFSSSDVRIAGWKPRC